MVYVGTHKILEKVVYQQSSCKRPMTKGGYFFMFLYSVKRLHSYIWEELRIDQDIIDRVVQLAREEKEPGLDNNQHLF